MSQKGGIQQSQLASGGDWFKWLIVVVLASAGIFANYYFSSVEWAIRMSIGIVLFLALIMVAYSTARGKSAWLQIKGARSELRKVVWPTKQETIQTTIIVVIMVIITALVLWAFDSLFM